MSKHSALRRITTTLPTASTVALASLVCLALCTSQVKAQSSWQSDAPPKGEKADSAPPAESKPAASKPAASSGHKNQAAHKATKSETKDGVTVERNSDGTVDAYDSGDSGEMGGGDESYSGGGNSGVNTKGQYTGIVNGVRYRPGTSPYTRNVGGVTVRRGSDGSIETSDEVETPHWIGSPSGTDGMHHAARPHRAKSHGGSAKPAAKTQAPAKKSK